MSLMKWKPSFSLGIPGVDLEHRELIEMINEAYSMLEDDTDPAQVEAMLGEIMSGISAHFALEERLMINAAYPEYPDHKASHEALLDDIFDLVEFYAADPEKGRELLKDRLTGWFETHFATFDARLHGAL